MGKVIIFSAPSGAGKSTIVNYLLEKGLGLEFSISATCRAPRGKEIHGKEYYFFTADEFRKRIENKEFLEWEEVYPGCYYGTLLSEIDRIWAKGHTVLFDVDVVGGLNIKKKFGDNALSIFIQPPSVELFYVKNCGTINSGIYFPCPRRESRRIKKSLSRPHRKDPSGRRSYQLPFV